MDLFTGRCSAERSYATVSRLSVCDVGVYPDHTVSLNCLENNYPTISLQPSLACGKQSPICSRGSSRKFRWNRNTRHRAISLLVGL